MTSPSANDVPSAATVLRVLLAERAHTDKEFKRKLKELVVLIHELDPIRRNVFWSSEEVFDVARRQNFMCAHCGQPLEPLRKRRHHVDHRIPWALGGGNERTNIQILHKKCNLSKGDNCNFDELLEYLENRLRNI